MPVARRGTSLGRMRRLERDGVASGVSREALRLVALLASGLVLMVVVAACGDHDGGVRGSGTVASETRDVDPFANLHIRGAADVSISIGEPQSLVVETDDNLLELLETDVGGDTLEIKFSERVSPRVGPDVEIVVPALEGIKVDGAAEIAIDAMAGEELEIIVNGVAAVRGSGTVDRLKVDVNGAGVISFFDLVAEEVDIAISGSGDAEVHATRSLSATVTGSGEIVYQGDPLAVATNITGSGSIAPG